MMMGFNNCCTAAAVIAVALLALPCNCTQLQVARNFAKIQLCPNELLISSQQASSILECGASCVADTSCSIYHFNQSASLCYHSGDTCDTFAQLWSNGSCESFKKIGPGSGYCSPTSSTCNSTCQMVNELNMKLLYRFGRDGLVNVAAPGNNTLQSGSATVNINGSGAHFVENVNSYLEADTHGFEGLVNTNNTYSLFVVASHPKNIDSTYAVFKQCGSSNSGHDFYSFGGKVYDRAYWPDHSPPVFYESASPTVFTGSSSIGQFSFGVTYNGLRHENFFANGNWHGAVHSETRNLSAFSDSVFQCLHLGGFPGDSDYSVRGNMQCFGMSAKLLNETEFEQLHDWCVL